MKNSADFVERITINIVNFTKGNSLFGRVSEKVALFFSLLEFHLYMVNRE